MKKSFGILFTAVLAITSLSMGEGLKDNDEVAAHARVPEPWSVETEVAAHARVPEPWSVGIEVAAHARVPEPWSVGIEVAAHARVPEPWSVKENFKA